MVEVKLIKKNKKILLTDVFVEVTFLVDTTYISKFWWGARGELKYDDP